jgi:hypothetical protein
MQTGMICMETEMMLRLNLNREERRTLHEMGFITRMHARGCRRKGCSDWHRV